MDKPKEKDYRIVNYLEAIRYLESKYPDLDPDELKGHGRKLWLILIDHEYISQDSYRGMDFQDMIDYEMFEDEKALYLAKLIVKEFPESTQSDFLWEICW